MQGNMNAIIIMTIAVPWDHTPACPQTGGLSMSYTSMPNIGAFPPYPNSYMIPWKGRFTSQNRACMAGINLHRTCMAYFFVCHYHNYYAGKGVPLRWEVLASQTSCPILGEFYLHLFSQASLIVIHGHCLYTILIL